MDHLDPNTPASKAALQKWSCHFLRVGACVLLHTMGLTEPHFTWILHWKSNAFMVYLRNIANLSDKHSYTFNMAAQGRQTHTFQSMLMGNNLMSFDHWPTCFCFNQYSIFFFFLHFYIFFDFFPAVCALPIDMVLDTISELSHQLAYRYVRSHSTWLGSSVHEYPIWLSSVQPLRLPNESHYS